MFQPKAIGIEAGMAVAAAINCSKRAGLPAVPHRTNTNASVPPTHGHGPSRDGHGHGDRGGDRDGDEPLRELGLACLSPWLRL
jgi:hypothetical protein